MGGTDRASEWLRPIVENGSWDYCVVWKLGNDPDRFIEWLDCCCIGAYSKDIVKDAKQNHNEAAICRDTYIEHPVKTMACKALINFPSFIPLYSGVHGDVILANQPMWLNHANLNLSASESSNEEVGTRVLIPVGGVLIELFVAKHVEKDQKIIELVRTQCSGIVNAEPMAEQRNTEGNFNECSNTMLPELQLKIEPSSLQSYGLSSFSWHLPADYPLTCPRFEGSSSVSNSQPLSVSSVIPHASHYERLKQSVGRLSRSEESRDVESLPSQETGFLEDGNLLAEKTNVTGKRYQSRNLLSERNRRDKIRGGLYALRALVPNISKMNKSAILGDAIDYIKELSKKAKELEDELKKMGEEDYEQSNSELKMSKSDGSIVGNRGSPSTKVQNAVGCGEKKHIKVSVDIHQMSKRGFLIRITWEKQQGGFVRLVQALNSLDLLVIDVSATTSSGTVLYRLIVEGCKEDIQLKTLRKNLMELMTG